MNDPKDTPFILALPVLIEQQAINVLMQHIAALTTRVADLEARLAVPHPADNADRTAQLTAHAESVLSSLQGEVAEARKRYVETLPED